jgi:hypothetical protein
MRKMMAVLVLTSSLAVAGPASAHGHGGDVVGALIGGAVIGAVIGAAINSAPAVAYQAPPVYAPEAPVPVYAAAPAGGYCYDPYSRNYVACAPAEPAPAPYYGGYPQAGW